MSISKELEERILKLAKRYDTSKRHHAKVGISDSEIATYASYVEFGWTQTVTLAQSAYLRAHTNGGGPKPGAVLHNPPRPIFRGTFSAEHSKWAKAITKALKTSDELTALKTAGLIAQSDLKATIANGGTTKQKFSPRSDLTMKLYANKAHGHKTNSTPGNTKTRKPLVLTGAMLNAIGVELE